MGLQRTTSNLGLAEREVNLLDELPCPTVRERRVISVPIKVGKILGLWHLAVGYARFGPQTIEE
jgi:hypothetical protein